MREDLRVQADLPGVRAISFFICTTTHPYICTDILKEEITNEKNTNQVSKC